MDTLTNLLQGPTGKILILAGIALVFFTFFEVSKGSVRMRKSTAKTKTSLIPAAIGAVLILIGLFSNPQAASPSESTAIPLAVSEVVPVLPSATTAPTDTPTSTPSPTETLTPTLTASPAPEKTIAENCISVKNWTAVSDNGSAVNATPDQNNCLNVGDLGFAASGGALLIVKPEQTGIMAAGIYTDVGDQAEIKFNVSVQNLYTAGGGNSAYLTFAAAPKNDVMTKSGSGRFKLQVNGTGNNQDVLFVPADVGEANGLPITSMHYLYGLSYNVRLKLDGLVMSIYIGEGQRPVETVSIPGLSKVFYIGYSAAPGGTVRATIKDLTIDGVDR